MHESTPCIYGGRLRVPSCCAGAKLMSEQSNAVERVVSLHGCVREISVPHRGWASVSRELQRADASCLCRAGLARLSGLAWLSDGKSKTAPVCQGVHL